MDLGFFSKDPLTGVRKEETVENLRPSIGRGRGKPVELPTNEAHCSTSPPQTVFHRKGKARSNKPNGYIEFLKHMKKLKRVEGHKSVNELIKMFDGDWKALSEEKRKQWKDMAKDMERTAPNHPAPSSSASAAPPPPTLGSACVRHPGRQTSIFDY